MTRPPTLPPLPGLLGVVAKLVGYGAAVRLAADEGGKRLYMPLPNHLTPGHWLVKAIGMEGARKVAEHYAAGTSGDRILVPLGPTGSRAKRWAVIKQAILAGGVNNDLAHALGIDERTVRRHRSGESAGAGRQADKRQARLFD